MNKLKELELKELKVLLEKVPDSYPDFVEAGLSEAKNYPTFAGKVTEFIESNPNSTTSDIIKFETEYIFGINPISK